MVPDLVPDGRLAWLAGAGLAAMLAVLASAVALPAAAMRGLLTGAVLAAGLPIGALAILLTMRLVPGHWVEALWQPMAAAARLALLAGLLFLPVLIGFAGLFPEPHETGFRAVWLNREFLTARTVLFFAVLAYLADRVALRGEGGSATAVLGLVFVAVFGSAVAVDWLMALSPDFTSSGFGLYVLSIWLAIAMLAGGMLALAEGTGHAGPIGAMMLTTLLSSAYLAFMQYLIVWNGDLAHKVVWYEVRGGGPWGALLWLYALCTAVPMAAMLFPPLCTRRRALMALAAMALAGKALEIAWIVLPSGPFGLGAVGLAAVAVGGTTLLVGAVFLTAASRPAPARRERALA